MRDLTYAVRALFRARTFSLTAVVTLALAIAVNTIVFTLLNSLALRPMPVRDGGSVFRILPVDAHGHRQNLLSFPHYRALETSPVAAGIAAYLPIEVTAGDHGGVREALAYMVSSNYFSLLGIRPSIGRWFSAEEERADARVVVISHALWMRGFDGSESVLGRQVSLNGSSFTVVGVGPGRFMGTEPLAPDYWVPLTAKPLVDPGSDLLTSPDNDWLLAIARLAPTVHPRVAENALSAVTSGMSEHSSTAHRPRTVRVVPATFFHMGPELRPVIGLVLGIVGLVLVIACANIASLVLTRAAARQREIAVRMALGASTWRLARHLLAESFVIAAAGGLVGLLFSAWTIRVLYPIGVSLLPFRWSVVLDLTPDLNVFAYTLGLSTLAGLGFGLPPLLHSSSREIASGLRDQAGMFGLTVRHSRMRRMLVIAQIAVCVMLLAAAALATRSLEQTRALDIGLDARGVVHTSADLVRHGYTPAAAADLHRRLVDRLKAHPDVVDVALTSHVPLVGGVKHAAVSLEERGDLEPTVCTITAISPAYFKTLRISFVVGRDFTEQETVAAVPVAIISDALARRFWPDGRAVGRRVTVAGRTVPLTIVGVVRDAADVVIWREKQISLYVPADPATASDLSVLVRTSGNTATVVSLLKTEARRIDPRLVFNASPLDEVLALWILPSRVAAVAAWVLGAIALTIAGVGIYGVMAYAVAQRKREIGVRMALGASRQDVRNLLLSDSGRLILPGLGIGLIGALIVTKAMASVLPEATPADPVALAAASTILVLAPVTASYFPARSAAHTDPSVPLRSD